MTQAYPWSPAQRRLAHHDGTCAFIIYPEQDDTDRLSDVPALLAPNFLAGVTVRGRVNRKWKVEWELPSSTGSSITREYGVLWFQNNTKLVADSVRVHPPTSGR